MPTRGGGAGRTAYGAIAGTHDDLVIAVALAVWRVTQRAGGQETASNVVTLHAASGMLG